MLWQRESLYQVSVITQALGNSSHGKDTLLVLGLYQTASYVVQCKASGTQLLGGQFLDTWFLLCLFFLSAGVSQC